MKPQHDPFNHHRRSIRLQEYDNTQEGAYYVTICTYNRECILGEMLDGDVRLGVYGRIALDRWEDIPAHFPQADLDEFVVMPNHVHGIIVILGEKGRGKAYLAPTPEFGKPIPGSLSVVVGSFKSAVTKRINDVRGTPGATVWQRGFYEHVIRDEDDLNRVRQYIVENPLHWERDHENPAYVSRAESSRDEA